MAGFLNIDSILQSKASLIFHFFQSSLCWGKQVQMYMNGILLIINLLFLLGTMAGLRMTFLFFVSLITPSIASSALGFFNRQRSGIRPINFYPLS